MKRRTALQATLALGAGSLSWLAPGARANDAPAVAAAASAAIARRAARASAPVAGSSLARLRAAGVLRVSVGSIAPWAFVGKDKGWAGLDVDVCERLASDMGLTAQFVESSQQSATDDVFEGRADIAASVRGSPRRALAVGFSDPYVQVVTTLIASRAKAASWATLADWNKPSVAIGVRGGTAGERVVRRRLPQATVVAHADEVSLVDALLNDSVLAIAGQTPAPEFLLAKLADRVVLPLAQPLAARSESFAVRRDDLDLLNYINTWLRYREESGWLAERREAWLRTPATFEGKL